MRSERQGRGNPYSCQDIAAGVIISPAESQPDARVRTQAIKIKSTMCRIFVVGLNLPDPIRKNGTATMKKTPTRDGRTVEGSPLLLNQPPEVCRWIDHQVDATIMAQANEMESKPANIAFFVDDTRTIRG